MRNTPGLAGALNLLLSLLFIAIALSVFFFFRSPTPEARHDLVLYASLTGAYGVWRLVRTLLAMKKQKENV
jgi:hypothetical protein